MNSVLVIVSSVIYVTSVFTRIPSNGFFVAAGALVSGCGCGFTVGWSETRGVSVHVGVLRTCRGGVMRWELGEGLLRALRRLVSHRGYCRLACEVDREDGIEIWFGRGG